MAENERMATPHVVWHLLKLFGDMEPGPQPQFLATAMQVVRDQLVGHLRVSCTAWAGLPNSTTCCRPC